MRVLPFLIIWCFSWSVLAETGRIRLVGDERVVLTSVGDSRSSEYCIWYEQAETLQTDWKVELITPDGGLQLKALRRNSFTVPFDLNVQPRAGAPFTRVHPETVLAKGSKLVSHCSPENASFRLNVQPSIAPELVPGGVYHQRLQLRLTAEGFSPVTSDIHLYLRVREQVRATVLGSIHLPDFDGRSEPVGETRLCLFRNGGGEYAVRFQGDGERGQYLLRGNGSLRYTAAWQSGSQPEEWLGVGERSRAYRGSSFPDCRGGHNASVRVAVPVSEAQKAISGRYQGRLRIIVQAR